MGLDVYLTKCANLAELQAREAAFERETDGAWATGVADEVREKRLSDAAAKHGTDKWGEAAGRETIEIASSIDPTHYFKVGYFRSSYNASGIDGVLRKAGIPNLGYIFGATGEDYEVRPDWVASLARADEVIVKYKTHLRSAEGQFVAIELRPMHEYGVASEKEALDLFVEEQAAHTGRDDFHSYSNRKGEFFLNGLTVRAAITKKFDPPTNALDRLINRPTVFLICDREKSEKEGWHLTALRIVRETIEYVLQQPERESFYLRWSG